MGLGQQLLLERTGRGEARSPTYHGAQAQRRTPQLRAQGRVHALRAARRLRLGHELLRHHAVLQEDADLHVPLAAIAQQRLAGEQERHEPVVEIAVGEGDHVLEEVVGPLDLVPVHRVVLAELEVLDVELAAGVAAQQVEGGEQPAAAAALLIGGVPVIQPVRHAARGGEQAGAVERDPVDRGRRHRVERADSARVGEEPLAQLAQPRLGELARGGRLWSRRPDPVSGLRGLARGWCPLALLPVRHGRSSRIAGSGPA
jgi:hypothetical protein